jgi:signal transduction histidine kinase
MTDSCQIFKNRFLLNFQSSQLEIKFTSYLQKNFHKYNIGFSIVGLIISLIDLIYENIVYKNLIENPDFNYMLFTRIISYIVTGIFLIQTCLICFVKNTFFQKFAVYTTYLLITFPFDNFREILIQQNIIDQNLFSLIRVLEIIIRVFITLLLLVPAPESYILYFLLLVISCIYIPFISTSLGIYTYIAVAIKLTLISYFYTKQVKTNFFINSMIQEQNEWFSNLLDHLNSGFLAFNSKKIKFINKNLNDLIKRLRNVGNKNSWNCLNFGQMEDSSHIYQNDKKNKFNKNLEENVSLHVLERKISQNSDKKNSYNFDINQVQEIVKNSFQPQLEVENEKMTKEILALLLNNIQREYSLASTLHVSQCNFNLDFFLKEAKSLYRENKMDQKFLLIGYKEFILLKEKDENNLFVKENTENDNNNFRGSRCKYETLNFEVYFRCHMKERIDDLYTDDKNNKLSTNYYNENLENEEIEIIFNDITKTKRLEQKSAELKYKSKFLSKIAHEFKNPLICISEITELIRQEKSFSQTNKLLFGDINELNQTYLRQIKSLSDYLLILIKDLNYFSFANLGIQVKVDKHEADLEEIIEFSKNIGEVLIQKYDKKNVSLNIIKNYEGDLTFFTDSIKLKQVLINLISNSVKYTNIGKIEFFINYFNSTNSNIDSLYSLEKIHVDDNYILEHKSEEFLEFIIKDSGIGIKEDRKLYFLDPLGINSVSEKKTEEVGLGLFIVQDILHQLDCKLEIDSKYGEGTVFSFKLPIKKLNSGKLKLLCNYNRKLSNLSLTKVPEIILEEEEVSFSKSINFKIKSSENSEEDNFKDDDSIETKKLTLEELKLNSDEIPNINTIPLQVNQHKNQINVNNYNNLVFNVDPLFQNLFTRSDTFENGQLSYISLIDPNTKFLIIVDDEKFTRKSTTRVIKHTLKKYFAPRSNIITSTPSVRGIIQILEFEDGVECIYSIYKLLKSGCRNITVISDENMMHMNGTSCAEIIKNLKNLNSQTIPFILLTAYNETNSRFIDRLISKPLSEIDAQKILCEHVGLRKIEENTQ